ncbi:hypothetical protein SAPIO_CDS6239 [Scedosporium apiospermum]|uniref:Uncharacterized protein n=1 Tax=Pseudallescheria apiosperma TaxID=563466 RepID=A0A084G4B4_PSEDA|nr:uncharacterized protein SAPIO_CDS6239 [Scedosporium apiospermum]KEZ42176.1 hypothetical protein SAPIO_CDS6239 [Scedosporium apiospermum]
MEAVAALSLACNVLQLVEQSYNAATFVKSLKDGHAPEGSLLGYSNSLRKLGDELRQLSDSQGQGSISECDQGLQKQAKAMLDVAGELVTELEKLKGSKRMGAVKYLIWKKGKIRGLEKDLGQIQQDMDTKVLLDLRKRLMQDQEQVASSFGHLRQQLQDFILKQLRANGTPLSNKLADQLTKIRDDIQAAIETEGNNTRDHFDRRLNEAAAQRQEERRLEHSEQNVQQFIKSLWFEEMHARLNQSAIEHFEGTFEWIFEPTSKESESELDKPRWKSSLFCEWLRNNKGLFWVSGKAGSGKSTLMQFLINHSRTEEIPRETRQDVLIISAFLWKPGTNPLQRSCKGVLCSLLYQILSSPTHQAAAALLVGRLRQAHLKRSPSDWSEGDLKSCLRDTIEWMGNSWVYIFIDGLDEADDASHGILGLVDFVQSLPRVKLCVSSRPEPAFVRKLEAFPHLRLQDLTRDDIEKFVRAKLCDCIEEDEKEAEYLILSIIWKAEGVFLWVRLVVNSVLRGIDESDDWEFRRKRVENLPNDLTKMYNAMWKRLGDDEPDYCEDAALYFGVMLHPDLHSVLYNVYQSVAMMMLVVRPRIRQELLENPQAISRDELDKRCWQIKEQIPARSAGLLEVSFLDEGERSSSGKRDWRLATVAFIHRSASDFLANEGRDILAHAKLTEKDIFEGQIVLSFMFDYEILPAPYQFCPLFYPGDSAMHIVKGLLMLKPHLSCADQIGCINTARRVLEGLPEWRDKKRDCLGLFACYGFTEAVECGFESEIKERLADQGYMDQLLSSFLRFGDTTFLDKSPVISWLLDNGSNLDSGETGTRDTAYPTPWMGYLLWLLSGPPRGLDSDKWYKDQERILPRFINRGVSMESRCALTAFQFDDGEPGFGHCTDWLENGNGNDVFSLVVEVSAGALTRIVFSNWKSKESPNFDSLIGTAPMDLKVIGIFKYEGPGIRPLSIQEVLLKTVEMVIHLDQHWSKREGQPDSVNLESLGECFSQARLQKLWEENKNEVMSIKSAAQWLVDSGYLQPEVIELDPYGIFTFNPTMAPVSFRVK